MSDSERYEYYFKILNSKKNWELDAWQLFHIWAYLYPENPTENDRMEALDFYRRKFVKHIFCMNCARHYFEILDIEPSDTESSSSLLTWTQKIHNMVNEKLGKKIFRESIEEWFKMGFYNLPDNEEQVTLMKEFISDKEQVDAFSKLYDENGRKDNTLPVSDILKKETTLFIRAQKIIMSYGLPLLCVLLISMYFYKSRRIKKS